MGIALPVLYEHYTPRSFINHLNGYWDHQNTHLRNRWEVARFQTVPQLNIHLKKRFKKEQDFCMFPWEKNTPAPVQPKALTPEIMQKIRELFT